MANEQEHPTNASRANVVIAALAVCTSLATLSFTGRIWGRSLSAVRFGWDDVLMTAALLGCWAITADNAVALHFGFGHHVEFLPSINVKNYIITLFAFFILQTFTTLFIKMAILMLYRRVFPTKRFHRAIYIVGAIIVANTLAVLLGFCFYCFPIARFWDHTISGKCINQPLFTTLGSLTLLISDLTLYIMPMPVIWKLKMTTRRKIETSVIFVIGGFICLIRIVQLVESIRLDFEDITWSNVDVAIWNVVESHIGCVVANVPLMGPLFTRVSKRLSVTGSVNISHARGLDRKRSAKYAVKAPRSTEHEFQRMADDSSISTLVGTMPPTIEKGAPDPLAMCDIDHMGRGQIMVRTDVEQECRGPHQC